jgi:hypothetical protein
MASKSENPAARVASEVLKSDQVGRLISAEPNLNPRSFQVQRLMIRFGLTFQRACLVADLAGLGGRP